MASAKIKVNLTSGEIEVAGSEKFIEKKLKDLPVIIDALRSQLDPGAAVLADSKSKAKRKAGKSAAGGSKKQSSSDSEFQSWHDRYPKKLSQNDSLILTGLYLQRTTREKAFTGSSVNALLEEQGDKISNPSVCLSQLVRDKKVVQAGKEGRRVFYKLTAGGQKHAESLLG